MALNKFKVGQRVRVVNLPDHITEEDPDLEGAVVVIRGTDGGDSDPYAFIFGGHRFVCEEKYLKPLTENIKWL